MSDPELEALRQQRLAQLHAQYKVNVTRLHLILYFEIFKVNNYFIPFG